MRKKVLAGIITYNPEIELLNKNIRSIKDQVDEVLIVDNHSTNVDDIRQLVSATKISLKELSKNEGIAYALNVAMSYGSSYGYKYMLSLDQDSICPDNIILNLLQVFECVDNVAVAAPVIVDRNVGVIGHNPNGEYAFVNTCITSGALTDIDIWKEIGKYDEKLFIDSVDFEFCYRVRNHGYKVVQTRRAQLNHSIGNGVFVRILFLKKRINIHNAFRCYYIAQNRIYYPKKHGLVLHLIRGNYRNFLHLIQILLYEDGKKEKIYRLLAGWVNGYRI